MNKIKTMKIGGTMKTAKRYLSAFLVIAMITGMFGYGNLNAQAEAAEALTGSQYPNVDDATYWIDRATYDAQNPLTDYAYSFALVGDTQILTRSNPTGYAKIYDWIVANAKTQKMKFVFGLGDITDSWGKVSEWEAGYENIHKLDGVVPYSVMRGNHDSTDVINQYFPYSDYENVLSGSYNGGIENTWRELTIGAMKYLIFVLDYGAEDAILNWAAEIIEAHPEHNVIITTHSYLVANGDLTNKTNSTCPPTRDFPNANNGEDMWNELISKHENIVLVLCGHEGTDEIVVSTKTGDHGNTVTQMMVNPQWIDRDSRGQGFEGVGMVAMMYFSEDGKDVQIRYYSTIHDKYFLAENQKTITLDTVEVSPKTVEKTDNLISVKDFTSTKDIMDVSTVYSYGYDALTYPLTDDTVVGKSFKTYVTYTKGTGSNRSWLFYGSDGSKPANSVKSNCISAYASSLGQICFTLSSDEVISGTTYQATQQNALVEGKEYLLEIDISEQNDTGDSQVTLKFDGTVMLDAVVDTTKFSNYITAHDIGKGAAAWRAAYRDCKADYEQIELKQKMDQAPIITAADFGLADGTHTNTTNVAFNKTCAKPIDGKKLVFELSDMEVYHTVDPYWAALDYGNVALTIQEDGKSISVAPVCHKSGLTLKSLTTTYPLKIEIYTEYMDLDGDKLNDDMRTLVRVNGTFMDLAAMSEPCKCGCGAITDGGYWLCTNDKLYSETQALKLWQNVGEDRVISSYTIASVNTHATAKLEDGVLTISGTGKVYPSVLAGVVTEPTTVKQVIIENGITSVASNVFNGFTNLKKVKYADSVQLVSDTAFVDCKTDVEITCPAGKEFMGGLKDAFIVKVVADVAVPETGIVNPAVIVTRVDSKEIYDNLSGSAVAILNIDSALNILDAQGQTIGTVAGFMEDYKNRIVPAFYLDDAAEATAIATYLKTGNNRDGFYMATSDNAALIKTAKVIFTYPRGILEYDELPTSLQERGTDRREINKNLAMVAVYPSQGLTADIVAEYNLRGISVWSYAEKTKDVYTGISNGVNGLVTIDQSEVIGVYESITEKTLSGKPQAIAHRGFNNHPNSTYPENTMETFRDSVEQGSAALEMDIHLTKNKELIVLNDAKLATGTTGEGYVSAYTLEELKELSIVRSEETTSYKIPSLREVFDEFKDTDVALYLHVNYVKDPQGTAAEGYNATYEADQLNALHSLVKEFEDAGHSIADNVVVFNRGMTYVTGPQYSGEYGLSLIGGDFTGTASGYYKNAKGDPYAFISLLNSILGGSNSQQLPTNYDIIETEDSLAYQMAARGYLTLQTVLDSETQEYLDNHFINDFGSTAIMTNHPEYLNDYAYQIDAKDTICVAGDTIKLRQKVAQIVGADVVSCGLINANTGETLSTGTYEVTESVEVIYYADIASSRGDTEALTYRIYSAPVNIQVVAASYKGDLDLDEKHTVRDLVKMIKVITEGINLSVGIHDVNGDGSVNAADISFMRAVLVGKETISIND